MPIVKVWCYKKSYISVIIYSELIKKVKPYQAIY